MIGIPRIRKARSEGVRSSSGRGGFTLVELMIGTLVAGIIITVAFQVLVGEQRSSEARRQEMNAQQNLRVAMDRITDDLRLAGFGIDEFLRQPRIVDAGPWQVAFNGDISSGVGGDPSMDATMEIKLSDGGTYNPGSYAGENLGNNPSYAGGAETVVLGLDSNNDGIVDEDDMFTDTDCPTDYAVYRGVNGLRTERLAFGLRGPDAYPDGTIPGPLYQYWGDYGGAGLRLWGDDNGDGSLDQAEIAGLTPVSVDELPNIVYVDVELATFTASAVAVSPHQHGTAGDPFKYMEIASNSRVRPRNIGINPANMSACGIPPQRPTWIWVEDTPDDAGQSITVHFNASSDEADGEEDVTHYFVYRREAGGSYGAAIAKVPAAGLDSYSYANDMHTPDEDDIPVDGVQYYYRVTSWDCKPQESYMSNQAGPVSSQPNGSAPPVLVKVYDTPCDSGGEISVVFDQSPDETGGDVTGYRVYRGPIAGDFLAKTLIGFVSAVNAPTYTYLDNEENNVAGAPPVNDTQYWYTVRAVTDTIVSVDSNELGPVAANDGLSAAPLESVSDVPFDTGTCLDITWIRSESENCQPNPVTGYRLQRKDPVASVFHDLDFFSSTGDPAYSVQDSGLLAGQPYTYRVVVKSIDDEQPSNELVGVPTNNVDLLPPMNLAADGVPCDASGAVRLTWERSYHDNGSGDVEWYRVWRRQEGGGAYGQVAQVLATASDNYVHDDNDSGSNPPVIGLTYQYVATAYNETFGNESSHSLSAWCTSASIPDAPYLGGVSDTPNDHGGSITVRFYASDDDGGCTNSVEHYMVYRSEEWGEFTGENIVGYVTATNQYLYTWYDNGSGVGTPPVDETSYYYMVQAYGDDQYSPYSNTRGPVMALDDAVVPTVLFQDGFESDLGWTHGGYREDWQRGDPRAKKQTYGDPDPEDAFLGSRVYGTDLGGAGWNGSYRAYCNSWLRSPAINCSDAENVSLTFARWLNVEQPIYDRAIIEVSGTGQDGPWHEIWRNSSEITDTSWSERVFDISNWADGQSDVRIRFRLQADGSWHYAGWNIDEVQIIGDN